MKDPAVNFLAEVPQIGTPRILREQINTENEAYEKMKNQWKKFRANQRKHLPSPTEKKQDDFKNLLGTNDSSNNDNESQINLMNSPEDDKPKLRKTLQQCPAVALFNQKLKRKMDEDYRRIQIQQERAKTKQQIQEEKNSTLVDLNEIRKKAKTQQRAIFLSRAAPSAKVSITHLGRVSKNAKIF